MQSEEQKLIDGLFSRLRDVEGQSAPRDAQAESLIKEYVSRQPAAPYYMAQAILVQENALKQLDARVKELEAQIEELKQKQAAAPQQSSGGFLSGLFGGGRSEPQQPARQPVSAQQPARAGGWQEPGVPGRGGFGQQPGFAQQPAYGQQPGFGQRAASGAGGFMSGALQTAAGVAGGMVLGNMLMNMFDGNDEHVASAPAEPAAEEHAAPEEHFAQDESYADNGYDSGDDGSFFGGDDFGGDDDSFI